MKKLFLFDIDGTLVGGVQDSTLVVSHTEDRFVRAIKQATGSDAKRDRDFRGYTDRLILIAMLQDLGWDDARINAALPALIKELDIAHASTFQAGRLRVLPGVKALLDALRERGELLGLLTGNLETVAKRKLEALGIWSYFKVGGFGSDTHRSRADLVKLAINRAGYSKKLSEVYLVGDTPKDIDAAIEAGVPNSVGVANGYRSTDELSQAGATFVFEDFTNTREVLAMLGERP